MEEHMFLKLDCCPQKGYLSQIIIITFSPAEKTKTKQNKKVHSVGFLSAIQIFNTTEPQRYYINEGYIKKRCTKLFFM